MHLSMRCIYVVVVYIYSIFFVAVNMAVMVELSRQMYNNNINLSFSVNIFFCHEVIFFKNPLLKYNPHHLNSTRGDLCLLKNQTLRGNCDDKS